MADTTLLEKITENTSLFNGVAEMFKSMGTTDADFVELTGDDLVNIAKSAKLDEMGTSMLIARLRKVSNQVKNELNTSRKRKGDQKPSTCFLLLPFLSSYEFF